MGNTRDDEFDRYFIGTDKTWSEPGADDGENILLAVFDRPQRIRFRRVVVTALNDEVESDGFSGVLTATLVYRQQGLSAPSNVPRLAATVWDVFDPASNVIWWDMMPLQPLHNVSVAGSTPSPNSYHNEWYGDEEVIKVAAGDELWWCLSGIGGDQLIRFVAGVDISIVG